MNEVNFIPASYLQRQRNRRSGFRQAGLVVVLAVLLSMWYAASSRSLGELRQLAESVERDVASAQSRVNEISRLREEEHALQRQARTRTELSPTINTVDVIGTIVQAIPPSLALRDLKLSSTRPTPPAKVEGAASSTLSKPAQVEPMKLTLVGLAPADVEVADFIGRLSASPIFTNVKMVYARPVQAEDLHAREFQIELEVPLDRDYQLADAEGVALAH